MLVAGQQSSPEQIAPPSTSPIIPVPQRHRPLLQVSMAPHVVPQPPQLFTSFDVTSMQEPPQQVSLALQPPPHMLGPPEPQ